jgi:hypothetical protein
MKKAVNVAKVGNVVKNDVDLKVLMEEYPYRKIEGTDRLN